MEKNQIRRTIAFLMALILMIQGPVVSLAGEGGSTGNGGFLSEMPVYSREYPDVASMSETCLAAGPAWFTDLASKSQVTRITFATGSVPSGTAKERSWPADAERTGNITAWFENDTRTTVRVAIATGSMIRANEDCSDMFEGFTALTAVSGLECLYTAESTDMSGMFKNCDALSRLDLSWLDTASVTSCDDFSGGSTHLGEFTVSKYWDGNVKLTPPDETMTDGLWYTRSTPQKAYTSDTIPVYTADTYGTKERYQITYNMMGHGEQIPPAYGYSGTIIEAPKEPVEYGALFQGWYKEEKLENKWDFATGTMPHSPLTLYAKWEIPSRIMAEGQSWYRAQKIPVSQVTKIKFDEKYVPTGKEADKWNGDERNNGGLTCYLNQVGPATASTYELTIKNYYTDGVVQANENSMSLFSGFTNLKEISGLDKLDTSGTKIFSHMFDGCSSLETIDISMLDTTAATSFSGFFRGCGSLKNIKFGENFHTENVTDMSSMFSGCYSLENVDLSKFDTSEVTDMEALFSGAKALAKIDMSAFDTGKVVNMAELFRDCSSLITVVYPVPFDTSAVTDMSYMFSGCSAMAQFPLNRMDTSNVTDMSWMFNDCLKMGDIDFSDPALSGFDTSDVTDMTRMFHGCENIKKLNVSGLETASVTNMERMFYGCSGLTELVLGGGFNTSGVKNMWGMFYGLKSLKQFGNASHPGLESFSTENAEFMDYMFCGCESLTKLDVTGFDTAKVKNMEYMFGRCESLSELDLNSFRTANVLSFDDMFAGCAALTSLSLTSFNTKNATAMRGMFANCTALTSLDISSFDTSGVNKNTSALFTDNTPKLAKIRVGTGWNGKCALSDPDKNTTDGYWYAEDGTAYKASALPKNTAGVYTTNVIRKQITYIANGHGKAPTPKFSKPGDKLTYPQEPQETGWKFTGWYREAECKNKWDYDKDRMPGEELKLYAGWVPVKYTVKFNGNGETSGTASTQDFVYGTAQKLKVNTFAKTGHTFTNWSTVKAGDSRGTDYKDGESVINLTHKDGETVILYAQWSTNKYTVRFFGNGSTGGTTAAMTDRMYGRSFRLNKCGFEKTGCRFTGWNTQADGKGLSYIDEQNVINMTIKDGDVIDLYAQWELARYSIVYELNGGINRQGNPSEYTIYSDDIVLLEPTRSGFDFLGWYADEEMTVRITAIRKGSTGNYVLRAKWKKSAEKSDTSMTGGSGGTSGGSGGTSGGSGGGSPAAMLGTAAKEALPSYVEKDGTWNMTAAGTWTYTAANGTPAKNEWRCLYNQYATGKTQRHYDWFCFDEYGNMRVGWYTDKDGNRYFLSDVSDGTLGKMVVGWRQIGNLWYLFNDAEGSGTMGALIRVSDRPE